jgi:hypothetical protein
VEKKRGRDSFQFVGNESRPLFFSKLGTVILLSRADEVVPFADSEELASNSRATLIEVGTDHRLADPEPLVAMLKACERAASEIA